ncbi:MAG TPA: hypothetical protein VGK88_06895 [bacterium]|jgi:hypothetical protein
MRLETLHALGPLILAAVVVNLLLAGWAFLAGLAGRRTLNRAFWIVLLIGLVLVVLEAAAGILLAAGGARPRTLLHILYGVLVSVTAVVQFGLRPDGFLRRTIQREPLAFNEPRVMALVCLTQAALLMRAYMTGALGR